MVHACLSACFYRIHLQPPLKVTDVLGPRAVPPLVSHGPEALHEFRATVRKILAQLYAEYQAQQGVGPRNQTPEQV